MTDKQLFGWMLFIDIMILAVLSYDVYLGIQARKQHGNT